MPLDIPLCRSIPLSNQLCFPLPGGGKVCSPMGLGSGDLSAIIQGQLGLMSSSMGALGPIFIILDVLQTLIECVTGIKDALGPPPDPSKLIKCIEKLVKLVAAIAGLLPQVWAPKAVKSFLETILAGLEALKSEIQSFIRQQERINFLAVAASKPGNASLAGILNCVQSNYQSTIANTQTGFGPLNQMITIVNGFMELAQMPKDMRIPAIEMDSDPATALDQIDPILTFLRDLLSKIPL